MVLNVSWLFNTVSDSTIKQKIGHKMVNVCLSMSEDGKTFTSVFQEKTERQKSCTITLSSE